MHNRLLEKVHRDAGNGQWNDEPQTIATTASGLLVFSMLVLLEFDLPFQIKYG